MTTKTWTCPECGETVTFSSTIHTGVPGSPNYTWGKCACVDGPEGEWSWQQYEMRGDWGGAARCIWGTDEDGEACAEWESVEPDEDDEPETAPAEELYGLERVDMVGIPAATLAAHEGRILVRVGDGSIIWIDPVALAEERLVGAPDGFEAWLAFWGWEQAADFCDCCDCNGLITPDAPERGVAVREIYGTLPRYPRAIRLCDACWAEMSEDERREFFADPDAE